ncbi:MAG: QueT transporter family protein [Lachnospiraceae bacterium]|nr:QueT transporter family protein [Lachnospiraceae bacterium]
MNKKVLFIAQAAVIAALYTVLTVVAAGFDLASGMIQVRFSEALTIMPFFTPAAIPGLAIGCLLSNIITGCMLPDIIFGSLATLLGAVGSWYLRKNKILVTIPPVISNCLIIPFVLTYAYGIPGGIPLQMLTVGIGEVISCMLIGSLLLRALLPVRNQMSLEDSFNRNEINEEEAYGQISGRRSLFSKR